MTVRPYPHSRGPSNPSDGNSVDKAVAFIVIQTCLAMNKSSKRLVSDCSDGFDDSMILRNQNAKKVVVFVPGRHPFFVRCRSYLKSWIACPALSFDVSTPFPLAPTTPDVTNFAASPFRVKSGSEISFPTPGQRRSQTLCVVHRPASSRRPSTVLLGGKLRLPWPTSPVLQHCAGLSSTPTHR